MRNSDGSDRLEMDAPADHSRRQFLTSIGAASLASAAGAAPAVEAAQQSRSEYLLAPGLTYLNTASLGPTSRAVLDRTLEAWRELESNPVHMAYADGPSLAAADRTRDLAAALIGCTANEILITRSTTDAMNSLAQCIRLLKNDRVLMTDQEHEGGRIGWEYRARRDGLQIDVVPIAHADQDGGEIVKRIAAAITPATKVISVSHVLSSTGLRMPIAEIAQLARSRGVLSVVDGAQAVGQIDVNVKSLGCHAYATAGHKWLMGPKGTGLLYVDRDAVGIEPIQWEDGRRFIAPSTGVGSLPLAVGLGAAIEDLRARGMRAVESHNLALRHRAYEGLKRIDKLEVVSSPPGPLATALVAARLPPAIDSRQVRDTLRLQYNIVVKMAEKRWFNGIRLSPHIFNTDENIDAALQAIRTVLG